MNLYEFDKGMEPGDIGGDQIETLIIRGGRSLHGSVELSGAKNAALPIIVGATLAGEKVYLKNVPLGFEDVKILLAVLQEMGVNIKSKDGTLLVDGNTIHSWEAPYELSGKIRYSLLLLGSLLTKQGKARIPNPGGCAIGERKFDLHIHGLRALGARIELTGEYIEASAIA